MLIVYYTKLPGTIANLQLVGDDVSYFNTNLLVAYISYRDNLMR